MRISETTRTVYKVRQFLEWQKAEQLVLSPSFQRREIWKPAAKSFLIDSVARNFPLPPILLREKTDNLNDLKTVYEVVDGQQRLRTLLSYIDSSTFKDYKESRDYFKVKKYHNTELADKDFKDLPKDTRRRLLDYQIVVHILPSDIEDREILDIFSRLNSTGIKLNGQELRNAAYVGEFKTCMYNLTSEQLSRWRSWKLFSESQITRMQEVEFTSECIMLILDGIGAKSQKAIDNYYEKYEDSFPKKLPAMNRYRTVMDTIDKNLGAIIDKGQFKKITIFYPLFAAFYDKIYSLNSTFGKRKPIKIDKKWIASLTRKESIIADGRLPKKIAEALSGQTNSKDNRTVICKYLVS